MTDQEFELQKKRVTKVYNEWRRDLGLGWWRVNLVFSRSAASDDDETWNTVGSTLVKWAYRKASITFFMPSVALVSDEELEEIVVHECCHVIVNEMREAGHLHEERVVSSLTEAFKWVRQAGIEEGERRARKSLRRSPKR